MHIRKDDMVKIKVGDDKGKTARVIQVVPKRNLLIVEGINQVFKHMKRSRKNPQGGRLQKEAPINASKVMLICSTCKDAKGQPKGVRIGLKVKEDGTKVRVCKSCGAELGKVS